MTKIKPLFFFFKDSFPVLGLKFLLFFISGLYLSGLSFSLVNVYGFIDSFIPIERVIMFVVGLFFLFVSSISLFNLTKKYIDIINNKKEIINDEK